MPRYFIDTDDDDTSHTDRVGYLCDDDQAARITALEALPDMARDQIPDGDSRTFTVQVRDEHGQMIYRATMTLKGEWRPQD